MSRDPEHFAVDVGYRDPMDERDDVPDPPPTPDEYRDDRPAPQSLPVAVADPPERKPSP